MGQILSRIIEIIEIRFFGRQRDGVDRGLVRAVEDYHEGLDSDCETASVSTTDGWGAPVALQYGLPPYDVVDAINSAAANRNMIDSHCHLDFIFRRMKLAADSFPAFRQKMDFPKCYAGCIAVFCDPRTWLTTGLEKELEKQSDVRAIYGCHPHFADHMDQDRIHLLRFLLSRPNVAGLGEIGLDYSGKNNCDRTVQKRVFKAQLLIAIELNLPICLHLRGADEDGFAVLTEVGLPVGHAFHVHCFNGSWELCQRWLSAYSGCRIGFTPLVTRPNAKHIHDVVERIPLDRLLLETDAPYFVPDCMRSGTSNSHPGMVIHTAAQIAAIKKIPVADVLKANRTNVAEVYNNMAEMKMLYVEEVTKKGRTEEMYVEEVSEEGSTEENLYVEEVTDEGSTEEMLVVDEVTEDGDAEKDESVVCRNERRKKRPSETTLDLECEVATEKKEPIKRPKTRSSRKLNVKAKKIDDGQDSE